VASSVRAAAIIVALALPFAAAARQTSPGSSDDDGRLAVGFACSDGSFTPWLRAAAAHGGRSSRIRKASRASSRISHPKRCDCRARAGLFIQPAPNHRYR